jgi:hypothetical protein
MTSNKHQDKHQTHTYFVTQLIKLQSHHHYSYVYFFHNPVKKSYEFEVA